jgi:hypothetical protein
LRPLSGLDLSDDLIDQTVAARGAPEFSHPAVPVPAAVPPPEAMADDLAEAPADDLTEVSAEVLAEAPAETLPAEALAEPPAAVEPADAGLPQDEAPSPPEALQEGEPDVPQEGSPEDGAAEDRANGLAPDGEPLADGLLVPAGDTESGAVGELLPGADGQTPGLPGTEGQTEGQPSKKRKKKREPIPGAPTPRHRWVRITVEMPDYVADQIRDRAHLARIPMRFAVMQAFRTARYKIADSDMVEDHRKVNGSPAIPGGRAYAAAMAIKAKEAKEEPEELGELGEPKDEVLAEVEAEAEVSEDSISSSE